MAQPIRLLLLEDSDDDVRLLMRHFRLEGLEVDFQRVETAQAFQESILAGGWDLVISDFRLPGYTGLEAIRFLRSHTQELPIILVSGLLGEEAAVEVMRSGANDFVLKTNLGRLVPAIRRELREAERRRLEHAHEHELRLLHMAISQTPDPILITDPHGNIVYVNPALEAVSGYDREELLGRNPRVFKSEEHDDVYYASMWQTLLLGQVWRGSMINKRKDGTTYEVKATITPVWGPDGQVVNYLLAGKDVTHERELQNRLEQSQRLEAIGVLTGGIAHDFNNILTPIMGHVELALRHSKSDPKLVHHLEAVQGSAARAADLVRQILSFSRKEARSARALDLPSLLQDSLRLLQATHPTTIAFAMDIDPDGGTVAGDPTQIHQIILNLCTNAAQAMKGQYGRLQVRLAKKSLPDTTCAMGIQLPAGQYLALEVADSGPGIDPAQLDQIFLPFFTTKGPQEGTGLGLSIVHGLVSEMGGGIQVVSQVGVGTTFTVFLPRVETAIEPMPVHDDELPQGNSRLMLVDDELDLLRLVETVLSGLGYHISAFTDPRLALDVLESRPGEVDALITDLTMPHLNGLDLALAIRRHRPELPVILTSGYAEPLDLVDTQALGAFTFLKKPYTPRDIAMALHGLLGKVTTAKPTPQLP